MKQVSQYAAKHNLTVALENHGGPTATAEQVNRILDGVDEPNIGVNYDPANFLMYGADPFDALKKLSHPIVFTHFKSLRKVKGKKEYCRIKDGVILFKGVTHVSRHALAADARRGETSLRMFNVDGLAPGDWIMVDAPGTERWRHVIASRCRFTPRLAMVRIERIAGTTLTINQPLRIDFPRIDSPHVTKMAPISDCGVEDVYTHGGCRINDFYLRFDIISVLHKNDNVEINHIKHAFQEE